MKNDYEVINNDYFVQSPFTNPNYEVVFIVKEDPYVFYKIFDPLRRIGCDFHTLFHVWCRNSDFSDQAQAMHAIILVGWR
jgi:hypothetical protein